MAEQTQQPRTEIASLGEFKLIDRITEPFQLRQPSSIKGIGDDAAVIAAGNDAILVSTDMLVEGVHFDLMYTPLRHLGYKAVVVNLSDIYAMNGQASQITVSLALSNRFSVEAIEELYAGVRLACEFYGVDLVGGDTTSSLRGLVISVTAIGKAKREAITYRSGAKPGDLLCITGNLGAAYLGLQILEREKEVYLADPNMQPELEENSYLIERQLKPEARADIIRAFAKNELIPTAMIDISDGLSSEVFHLCHQSKVGAIVEEAGVPIHPDAQMQAITFNLDPITTALNGGEDYELLFTIDPQDIEKVKYLPDIYIAGELTEAAEGIKLHTKGGNIHDLQAQGWNPLQQQ